jgi:hypothetical protein
MIPYLVQFIHTERKNCPQLDTGSCNNTAQYTRRVSTIAVIRILTFDRADKLQNTLSTTTKG